MRFYCIYLFIIFNTIVTNYIRITFDSWKYNKANIN